MPRRPTSTSTRRSPRGSWRRSTPISRARCASSRTGGTTRCSASATGTSVRMPRRVAAVGLDPQRAALAARARAAPARRGAGAVRERPARARARLRRAVEHRAVVRRRERTRVRSRDARRRRERARGVRRRAERHAGSGGCAGERVPRRAARCTATRPCAPGSPAGACPTRSALLRVWERATRGIRVDRAGACGCTATCTRRTCCSRRRVPWRRSSTSATSPPATPRPISRPRGSRSTARSRRIFRAELEARRGVDEATWDRARGWALVIATRGRRGGRHDGQLRQRGVVRAGAGAAATEPARSSTVPPSAMRCTDAAASAAASGPGPREARRHARCRSRSSPRSRVAPSRPSSRRGAPAPARCCARSSTRCAARSHALVPARPGAWRSSAADGYADRLDDLRDTLVGRRASRAVADAGVGARRSCIATHGGARLRGRCSGDGVAGSGDAATLIVSGGGSTAVAIDRPVRRCGAARRRDRGHRRLDRSGRR